MPFTAASNAAFLSKPRPFFASPEPAGRRIVCGFSYLQRIRKGATTNIWFPSTLHQAVAERIEAGDASVLDEFRMEWAAIRQFELLQEADNFYIYDLEVANFKRAFEDIMKMRAGGYRVTVITLGHYIEPTDYDELRILDRRLQDEITRIIHMLFLEDQSAEESFHLAEALKTSQWHYAEALPHVAMTLGAAGLFNKTSSPAFRQQKLSQGFFRILELLPQRHIAHDVAVGLTLPDASKERNWVFLARKEHQYHAFQTALGTVFSQFDHISLGALHERANAGREAMPVMHHMRGYGDRLNSSYDKQNRAMAREVAGWGLN